jgi:hypothetical protein
LRAVIGALRPGFAGATSVAGGVRATLPGLPGFKAAGGGVKAGVGDRSDVTGGRTTAAGGLKTATGGLAVIAGLPLPAGNRLRPPPNVCGGTNRAGD